MHCYIMLEGFFIPLYLFAEFIELDVSFLSTYTGVGQGLNIKRHFIMIFNNFKLKLYD